MSNDMRHIASIGQLYNIPLVVTAVAFTAIAWFNALEMIITTCVTFKKRSAYFYSLLVCCVGILCYETSIFCLAFSKHTNAFGINVGVCAGWTAMVTGQSLVLWSRLHLVCWKRAVLRGVLAMIIVDGILCHGTQWVCSMLAVKTGVLNPFYPPFRYAEKVTLCIFFVQEVIISSIYIWQASRLLRNTSLVREKQAGKQQHRMRNLIGANVVILFLDVCLIALEFAAPWGVWSFFKGFAYSVKVKIEFHILNQLRNTMTNGNGDGSSSGHTAGYPNNRATMVGKPNDFTEAIPMGSQAGASASRRKENVTSHSGDHDKIMVTHSYAVSHSDQQLDDEITKKSARKVSDSPSSSEIEFASKGV